VLSFNKAMQRLTWLTSHNSVTSLRNIFHNGIIKCCSWPAPSFSHVPCYYYLSIYISIYLCIYLSICLSIYLWLYSPSLGLGSFSVSLSFIQPVGLWTRFQPIARPLPAPRTAQTENPCLKRDSNPRPQCLSGRRQFMS
jgi:hypothetical protein